MMHRQPISCFVSTIAVSLMLLVLMSPSAHAQKIFRLEKDSIPLFRGFQVSFDMASAAMMALGSHGEIEGALRVNLHDQWFPTFEMGIGHADHHEEETTGLRFKTTAPYFRLGMDVNCMKNKHLPNRLYAGVRYAFTTFNCDIERKGLEDPIYKTKTDFGIEGMRCSQHWLELVFGIDAQIYGPLHLGWTVRYLRRLIHKEGDIGEAWYVPGYGQNNSDHFNANFNLIIDI